MDLSQLSDSDLQALAAKDFSKVSTEGLQYLATTAAPARPKPQPKEAGFLETVGANLAGGLGSTLTGAGAALADYTGASDTAKYLDEKRKQIQQFQQEHGGETTTGRIASGVGGMAPALLEAALAVPTGGASLIPLISNAGLFAVPAFRDTFKEQMASGAPQKVAVEHALAEAGLMLVGGKLIGAGGKALPKALRAGEGLLPSLEKKSFGQLAGAGAEGAAFNVADTAINKGIDVYNDRDTDKPWIDPKAALESAATFGIMRGLHRAVAGAPPKAAEPPPPEAPPATTPIVQDRPEQTWFSLLQEKEALKQATSTPEIQDRIRDIDRQMQQMTAELYKQKTAEAAQTKVDEAKAKESAFASSEPQQMEIREAQTTDKLPPRAEEAEPAPEGLRDVISAELPATTEVLHDAGIAPTAKELEDAGQQRLDMHMPAPLTEQEVVHPSMSKANKQWMLDNIVGKTPEEAVAFAKENPDKIPDNRFVKKAFKEIEANIPTPETQNAIGQPPTVQPAVKPRAGKRRVDVPVQPVEKPAGTDTGVTTGTDQQRLVSTEQPANAGVSDQTTQQNTLGKPVTIDTAEIARQKEAADMAARMAASAKRSAQAVPETARTVVPDRSARREGAVDVVGMLPHIRGALDEILRSPKFSENTKKDAQRHMDALDASEQAGGKGKEGQEFVAEMAFNFLTEQASKTRYAMGTHSVVSPEEGARIREAVHGKSVLDVADWAAKNMPTADYREIAKRVAETLRELQKTGLGIGKVTVTGTNRRLSSGARGVTIWQPATENGRASSVDIHLNHEDNGANSGVNPVTVLHELIHAATMGVIDTGSRRGAANTRMGKAVLELIDLQNTVVRRLKERKRTGAELTDFEKQIFEGANALASEDELLAWGLTSRDMQQYLESIPYKNTTMWDKFTTLIRDMLGLPPKFDTALSELLRLGGELTSFKADELDIRNAMGMKYAMGPDIAGRAAGIVHAPTTVTQAAKQATSTAMAAVKPLQGIGAVDKVRTLGVDRFAAVSSRLATLYDGAVRDAAGKVNVLTVARQAEDVQKMLPSLFEEGGLRINPATGLYETYKLKDAPQDLYKPLQKWIASKGLNFETGYAQASTILEGVRVHELVKQNAAGATDALIHWRDTYGNIDTARIAQAVAEYNASPELKEVTRIMDAPRIELINELEQVGRLTAEDAKFYREAINYVPFDRLSTFDDKYFSSAKRISGRGLAQLGKLPELIGSEVRPVGNVIDNYFKTMGWLAQQVVKQNANTELVRAMESVGAAKYIGPSQSASKTGFTIPVFRKGEKVFFDVPTQYDSAAFIDAPRQPSAYIRLMSKASRLLRLTVTANPAFAAAQVATDIQGALLTSGVKHPLSFAGSVVKNFAQLSWHELKSLGADLTGQDSKMHDMERQFGRTGLHGDVDYNAPSPASTLLYDLNLRKRTPVQAILHRLEKITNGSDLAVRKAVYDYTLKETKDELLADTRARELINFHRRGTSHFVQDIITTVPFLNATAQATDLLYRAATGKENAMGVESAAARKMFATRVLMYAAGATAYALLKSGDDEYDKLDRRQRDNNWILGNGVKIPIRGDIAIVKVAIENAVDWQRRQGTKEEQRAGEAAMSVWNYAWSQYVGRVTPFPIAIKPVVEAITNHSFLTGRELIGTYQQGLLPHMQEGKGTSEASKAIAQYMSKEFGYEVSPIIIDNTIRGYFGTSAAAALMVTDGMLHPNRPDRPIHQWMGLSNFAYDSTQLTNPKDEFYDLRAKVIPIQNTFNELAKTDTAKAREFMQEHKEDLALSKGVLTGLKQLSDLRKYRKYLESAEGEKSMSKERRQEQLDKVLDFENKSVAWVRQVKAMAHARFSN